MRHLCYLCDRRDAEYEARLDYDSTPVVWLCEECARSQRDWGAVVWIHRIKTLAP